MRQEPEIACWLRAARRERGWTQESLAERLGVSRTTVTNWELGVCLPSLPRALLAAELLGHRVDHIWELI